MNKRTASSEAPDDADNMILSNVQREKSIPVSIARNSDAPVKSVFSRAVFLNTVSCSVASVKSQAVRVQRSHCAPKKLP